MSKVNLLIVLLATGLGVEPARAAPKRINIAFDMMDVTMSGGRETPNFGEILAVLAKDPRVHIYFFSTQYHSGVSDQLLRIPVPGGRTAAMMGIILDGSMMNDFDRPKKRSGGWFDLSPSYGGGSYKDLRVIAKTDVDLANSILVDDSEHKAHPRQHGNFLWLPPMLGVIDDPEWVEPEPEPMPEPPPLPAPVIPAGPPVELAQSEPPKVERGERPEPPKPPTREPVAFEPLPGPTMKERVRGLWGRVVDTFSLPDREPLAPHPLDRNYPTAPRPQIAPAPRSHGAATAMPRSERARPERDEPEPLAPVPAPAPLPSHARARTRGFAPRAKPPRLNQRADLMLGMLKVAIDQTDRAPEGTTLSDTLTSLLWDGKIGTRDERSRYKLYDPKLQKTLMRYGRRLRHRARCEAALEEEIREAELEARRSPPAPPPRETFEPSEASDLGSKTPPEAEPPVLR